MHGLGVPLLALLLGSGGERRARGRPLRGDDRERRLSPCLTVGNGLAQAASGDTVKVARGLTRRT